MHTLIANRYEPINRLGQGGMGVVYCVKDRLSNREMALKQVHVNPDRLQFNLSGSNTDEKLSLAMEFRTLASLHHPHIVSVADYGFDTQKQPYFTMEYLNDAKTIVDYATGKSIQEKIRLLHETLQALTYLHQRRIIHRDLKPDNVLVDQFNRVKVMDFGLAVASDHQQEGLVGTLAYMAPEVFTEDKVSIQSDLFAIGIMAYEIFAGQHPYDTTNQTSLIDDILACQLDFGRVDEAFVPFIKSLTMKLLEQRPVNAQEALTQLSRLSQTPIPIESPLIRESFLQHSAFVGREEELGLLKDCLQGNSERGWLIGGESGVGKSRLLDELRIHALVEGILVLRGYEVEVNGFPYQLWRDIIRRLLLIVEVSEDEASILKDVVPDVASTLGDDIPDAQKLSSVAGQQRLTATILNLFRRLKQPTLLILEDLHWGDESLFVLKQLTNIIDELSVVTVASFRDDERPNLPQQLPAMQTMHLSRLSQDQIASLTKTIIGSGDDRDDIASQLHEQTEGNVFFLVEVIRALAEDSGGLHKVAESDLSAGILTSGIRNLLKRRIDRVPAEFQRFLRYVALAGRYLEVELLSHLLLHNAMPFTLDVWLQACFEAGVIEYVEEGWRFRHDKLRDAVLEDLDASNHGTIHRHIGEAIEALYPDDNDYLESLYHHWRGAGDIPKTLHYLVLLGDHLINLRARYDYAINILKTHIEKLPEKHPQYPIFANQISKAYRMQGDQEQAQHFGGIALRLAQQTIHRANSLSNLSLIEWNIGDYETAFHYASQGLALHRQVDDAYGIARGLNNLGVIADNQGNYQQALEYYEEAKSICISIDNQPLLASTLSNQALVYERQAKYEKSYKVNQESLRIREKIGDRYGISVSLGNLGYSADIMDKNDEALNYFRRSLAICREIGNQDGIAYAYMSLGMMSHKLQKYDEADDYYNQSMEILEHIDDKFGVANAFSNMGFTYIAQGNISKAEDVWYQSIEMCHSSGWLPILVEVLVGIGRIRVIEGKLNEAVKLAKLVSEHPATVGYTRDGVLAELFAQLTTKFGKDGLDNALMQVAVNDLDEVVDALLLERSEIIDKN